MERYKGRLLNLDANAKTVKGQARGYKTAILYLAPSRLSGNNVCPMATAGCIAACLNTAGQGAFGNVQRARITKTRFYFEHRTAFLTQLVVELQAFVLKTREQGFEPVVRLNGTSDILWERQVIAAPLPHLTEPDLFDWNVEAANIMALFPDVQFYDYTKHSPSKRTKLPANYRLVYSLNEDPISPKRAVVALEVGWNVAVVFRKTLPAAYAFEGISPAVVDGDKDDLRFLDPRGVIVGLKAKGRAKTDTSGFVRE